MAVWQADYHVLLPPVGLPTDYGRRLEEFLPRSKSWDEQLEVWGSEDGDRIDVFTPDDGPPELFARFDLREWKPALYERFLVFVQGVGATLREAPSASDVPLSLEAFAESLAHSGAAQFVRDPGRHLRSLKVRGCPR